MRSGSRRGCRRETVDGDQLDMASVDLTSCFTAPGERLVQSSGRRWTAQRTEWQRVRYTLMTVLGRRAESLMTVARSSTAATPALVAVIAAAAASAAAPAKTKRQEF